MDLISHQLDAILTFSAYFRFQLFVLMVLLGFHLPSNWHSFHWNECLILIIFIMIFTPLYQDIYPSLSGQLSFEWGTYLPLIIGTFSLSLLKLTPFYRDTNPKIFVNSIKFVGNHTSKFHNQLVYNSNVLNFLPLNLLKGFSKPIHFLTFQRKFSKLL